MATEKVSIKGRPKGTGKKRIKIEAVENQQQRMVSFSKRKDGLYRKADHFNTLIGFTFAIIVFSPTGKLYRHGNPSFDEVFGKYFKRFKEREAKKIAKNKLERGNNELVPWLQAIRLEEYDNVEELVILKEKLREIKEKAGKKIDGDIR